MSSIKTEKVERTRFWSHLKSIFLKPGLIFIQEHKMEQILCDKMGALGLSQGKALRNWANLNAEIGHYRQRTAIFMTSVVHHRVLDFGIFILGQVHWIICNTENKQLGFLNVYAPNRGREIAGFWNSINLGLSHANSSVVADDFNMVKRDEGS